MERLRIETIASIAIYSASGLFRRDPHRFSLGQGRTRCNDRFLGLLRRVPRAAGIARDRSKARCPGFLPPRDASARPLPSRSNTPQRGLRSAQ